MAQAEPTFLVVGDVKTRETIERALSGQGSVLGAGTFSEALSQLERSPADCVVLDDASPGSDDAGLWTRFEVLEVPLLLLAERKVGPSVSDAVECLPKSKATAEAVRHAIRHVMERSRSEAWLQQAEQRYKNLFDGAPVMYVVTREEHERSVIDDCNKLFSKTLGYARKELIERSLLELFTEDTLARVRSNTGSELAHWSALTEECDLRARDGRKIHTLLRAVPEPGIDGRP